MPERFDHIPGDPEEEPATWPAMTWIVGVLIVLAVSAIVFLGMLFVKSLLVSS
jgi:hypothetical protein